MLGKLLKYEFKATARIFLLMYAALLAIAALSAFLLTLSLGGATQEFSTIAGIRDAMTALTFSLYIVVIIAVSVLTLVIIAVRFYRMLGNEGYLQFTLPVTATQHIMSKLIVACVWFLASTVVVIGSLFLLAIPLGLIGELHKIGEAYNLIMELGFSPGLYLICLLALTLASGIMSILTLYAAMAIGPSLLKNRLGGSVLAFILIGFATQIISSVLSIFAVIPFVGQSEKFIQIATQLEAGEISELVGAQQIASLVDPLVAGATVMCCVGCLALAAVLYVLTRYFLTKKLNLA